MHDFYLPLDKGVSTMMICDEDHKRRIHEGRHDYYCCSK